MKTDYTMSRCYNDDTLYGKVHGGLTWTSTHCGLPVDEMWMILSNSSMNGSCPHCGKELVPAVTCPKCKKIMEKD